MVGGQGIREAAQHGKRRGNNETRECNNETGRERETAAQGRGKVGRLSQQGDYFGRRKG